MRKCFCDRCGKELDNFNINSLEIPSHLYSMRGIVGYVDTEFNPVSGKVDCVELCNHCYNKVFSAAVKVLEELSND